MAGALFTGLQVPRRRSLAKLARAGFNLFRREMQVLQFDLVSCFIVASLTVPLIPCFSKCFLSWSRDSGLAFSSMGSTLVLSVRDVDGAELSARGLKLFLTSVLACGFGGGFAGGCGLG